MRPCSLFILLCGCLQAGDPQLEALRTTLVPMRATQPGDGTEARGATPQLTIAKHQLLDWLDSSLGSAGEEVDTRELERSLNLELEAASLSCNDDGPAESGCPEWWLNGYAGRVTLQRSAAFIVATSGVGIECGYDESAYVYSWNGEKWVRVWENEQNTYTKDQYKPQTLHSVLISPYNAANDYLILTLGSESWCASNWHDVYYRVYRLGPDRQAPPLVSGGDWTAVGWRYPPIVGSISNNDVLIEYLRPSADTGTLAREGVFHYEIQNGQVRRTDPFALGPRDFVDEWLKTDWSESFGWSEKANARSMSEWWHKIQTKHTAEEFIDPTMHCRTRPDLWQVGINFQDNAQGVEVKPDPAYFLVRWTPPYRFRMVAVSGKPSSDCTKKDGQADDPGRRLFPIQEWLDWR